MELFNNTGYKYCKYVLAATSNPKKKKHTFFSIVLVVRFSNKYLCFLTYFSAENCISISSYAHINDTDLRASCNSNVARPRSWNHFIPLSLYFVEGQTNVKRVSYISVLLLFTSSLYYIVFLAGKNDLELVG